MKSEKEIREMLEILKLFNRDDKHGKEIVALSWVIGEYPLTEDDGTNKRDVPKPEVNEL